MIRIPPSAAVDFESAHREIKSIAQRELSRHAGQANQRNSARRVRAVADQLIALGVPPERISIRSHGDERPVVLTAEGVPERRNRRVEFE